MSLDVRTRYGTGVSLSLKGADQIFDKLGRIAPAMERKIVRRAMRAGSYVMLQAVKGFIHRISGALTRSVIVRAYAKKSRNNARYMVIVSSRKVPELVTITKKGKRYFYPAVLEFLGHPFVRPGFDASHAEAIETIVQEVQQGLDEELR